MNCPNSTESGCRCVDHHPGLGAYTTDRVTYARWLTTLEPARLLRVVTRECRDTMTCTCHDCTKHRVTHEPAQVRQPWEPRPARKAA